MKPSNVENENPAMKNFNRFAEIGLGAHLIFFPANASMSAGAPASGLTLILVLAVGMVRVGGRWWWWWCQKQSSVKQ